MTFNMSDHFYHERDIIWIKYDDYTVLMTCDSP